MIGTRLGPYDITAKLGEGGMGERQGGAVRGVLSGSRDSAGRQATTPSR